MAREMGEYLKTVPEVTDYQTYVGTAAPYQLQWPGAPLLPARPEAPSPTFRSILSPRRNGKNRAMPSRKRTASKLKEIGDRYGARIKVAEIPPGPAGPEHPGGGDLWAEANRRIEIARMIKKVFTETDGVVDVDGYVEEDQPKISFAVDQDKAARAGLSTEAASQSLRMALNGMGVGLVHLEKGKEPVELFLRMSLEEKSRYRSPQIDRDADDYRRHDPPIGAGETSGRLEEKTIYHKNLKKRHLCPGGRGRNGGKSGLRHHEDEGNIEKMKLPEGYGLKQYSTVQPWLEDTYSMKWDGEWHITYEVFRDMGMAFAAVLILIYVLIVAWFKNFVTPLIIMAPIPLTLVGILPGHWLFGAFFTATSMIGFIALAGIIVRNSILLVDFVEMEWREKGHLANALIMAGAVRFRPIVLTAAAVVVGSFVMLFDPIFQGLAIAMMFGAVGATSPDLDCSAAALF